MPDFALSSYFFFLLTARTMTAMTTTAATPIRIGSMGTLLSVCVGYEENILK